MSRAEKRRKLREHRKNWRRIGLNIERILRDGPMSRRELASRLPNPKKPGHSRCHSTVSSWINGTTKPSLADMRNLVAALGPGVLEPPSRRVEKTLLLPGLRDEIMKMAISVVTAGGEVALQHFHPVPKADHSFGKHWNPKLQADALANEAGISRGSPSMRHLSDVLGRRCVFFGEELVKGGNRKFDARVKESLRRLGDCGCHFARSSAEFAELLIPSDGSEPRLGIISDPIDGSSNLELGIGGQFVSAIAVMDGSELLASAIYEPHGRVLYSAFHYPGGDGRWELRQAEMRHLRSGASSDLNPSAVFGRRVLAFHATRSDDEKRKSMLGQLDDLMSATACLEENSTRSELLFPGGITAINCGQAALACVAARRYGAFVSTVTSIWDLAAGDLLLRNCGGVLTDFDGLPIDYRYGPEKVSVIAAWDPAVHAALVEMLHKVRARA